jgi:hypothetical protein
MNNKNSDAINVANSIIEAHIDDNFFTLDSALKAYYLLVSIISNEKEMQWAKNERVGYKNIKNIPEYRRIHYRDKQKCVFISQPCSFLNKRLSSGLKTRYYLYNNKFEKTNSETLVDKKYMVSVLETVSDRLFEETIRIRNDLTQSSASEKNQDETINIVINILNKFPAVANQLLNRYGKRETFRIEDEYDVQDLLHALLKIFYDDIRPEEATPSHAGKASRMDFLLKKEQIVIEVKKTSDKLTHKEVGDQLLIDIARYSAHPDCKTLICFVYDPEGKIENPGGLESDLNKSSSDTLRVIVKIEPKY